MAVDTPRPDPESERRSALALLGASERVLLTGHVRPDADCAGAEAALARVLAARGARVRVLNPGPLESSLDFLDAGVPFESYAGGPLPDHDLCVLLDASDLARTGALAAPLAAAPSRKLVVDHHVHTGPPWWDAAYRDDRAAATGLLVARIADELGTELDAPAAEAVFASLATDTGWFRFGNADAEAFALASRLVERGVEPAELHRRLHQRQAPGQPRALGSVLRRLEYHAEKRLAVVDWPGHWVSDEEVVGPLDDTGQLFDILRSVESVEVVLFLRELPDGSCKLSARAKSDDFDVQAFTARFGGGGHVRAAGATLPGGLDDHRGAVLAAALERFAELDCEGRGVG